VNVVKKPLGSVKGRKFLDKLEGTDRKFLLISDRKFLETSDRKIS